MALPPHPPRTPTRRRAEGTAAARCTAAFLALAVVPPAWAGGWHSDEDAACSDCHTMHNSSGGLPMRYDRAGAPAENLLRHATALSLCLYCHDGTNPDAPDVVAPITYVADASAGGFADSGLAAPNGHDLAGSTTVPPGGSEPMTLTCTTCHAPHGSPSHRNLVADPGASGAPLDPVVADQRVRPDGTNPAEVYVDENVLWRTGLSGWCGGCHGEFHGRTDAEEGTGSPWLRHPQDAVVSNAPHADFAHWSGTVTNRVRVQTPLDDLVPSSDDEVFCLTCHKAHGSQNRAGLVFADGASLRSTCQQCHHK